MKVLRSIDQIPVGVRFALTIGMFDGVHRGHESAIKTLVAAARRARAEAVVLTFDPHPDKVLRGGAPPLLCSPEERLARLAALGVDATVVQPFDREFAAQSPDAFLHRLSEGRQLVALVMTSESAFGRDRAGNLRAVKRLASAMRFRVVELKGLRSSGARLSSTKIRELVAAGRLADVRRALGRDYSVTGRVVTGDKRGRALGYPTANLAFEQPVVLPPDGIYAVRTGWGGDDPMAPERRVNGVASLGVRPTFGGGARTLEVHVFDMDEDLYGQTMRVEFVRRLRGEKKFESSAALVEQMNRDATRARAVLGVTGKRG